MLAECEAGIYLVEEEKQKGNIIGGRFELLWGGGDHCDLQNILWGEMSLKLSGCCSPVLLFVKFHLNAVLKSVKSRLHFKVL